MLSASGLTKRYAGAAAVLDAGLTLPVGGVLALSGPSGCGKSTLLRLLAGLVERDAGAVALDGSPLPPPRDRAGRRAWHRRVLLLPQDTSRAFNPVLRLRTQFRAVLALHGVGTTAAERDALSGDALERAGVPAAALDRFPDALSGGQRQRAALARLFLLRPRALLLDEPTAALDPATAAELLDLLDALRGEHGFGLLLSTHDPIVAHRADNLLRMEEGRIIEVRCPRREVGDQAIDEGILPL